MLKLIRFALLIWIAALAVIPMPVLAQSQQFVLGGPKMQIPADQKLMFQAATKTVKKDYKGAEELYSEALTINTNNINAYLQRGIVRRELGNELGTTSDASKTVTLANAALQNNPRDPNLYYQRGMGFRLLKNFNQAEKDLRTAIQLGGQSSWQTDLQALALERKTVR